jgi:hypothetical protein
MAVLPLDDDATAVFNKLHNLLVLSRGETTRLNQYYEGDRRIQQLGLAIPPELQQFTVFLNWPRVTVDGCEQRLDVTGFRLPGEPANSYLWETWQYNDLDELQSWAHTDALALARSYICVGTNGDDGEHPLVTVESPMEMVTLRDPATRRVTAALRLYSDQVATGQASSIADTRATLYLPDSTHWLINDGGWRDLADPDFHNLGVVPVVPMVNRDRPTRKTNAFIEGISEMADVIPIAESASRAVTNGQLAQETHAVPHRAVLGATKADFFDAQGNPLPAWDSYFGAITAMANPNAKMVQFDATDMSNFETMVNMYARLASGLASMPIEYFGLNTQNAPSAEGQRAGETRLIKKAERKQVSFGHAWESAMRLVLRFRDRVLDPDPRLRGLETMWRDAGTPTRAQAADATAKLHAADLIDWETAQEDLGRTPAQIEQMKARREADMNLALGIGVQQALVDAANAV